MSVAKRLIDAVVEPITFAEFVVHTNLVTGANDETYFNTLVTAVRHDAERYLNRSLLYQQWGYYPDEWPSGEYFELPYGAPLSAVSSVIYTKSDATTATFSTDYYDVDTDHEPGRITLEYDESWPTEYELATVRPIIITYYAGYGTAASSIPKSIKEAVLIQTAELWRIKTVQTLLVAGIRDFDSTPYLSSPFRNFWKSILGPYRVYRFG